MYVYRCKLNGYMVCSFVELKGDIWELVKAPEGAETTTKTTTKK